jgi:hypothetical protein
MPSDGLFHPSPDHIPPPREQGLEHSVALDTYPYHSDSNPRGSPRHTHLPHASARGSRDDSPYNTRSDSSSRSSWRGDSAKGQQRSWGPSYSDQGPELAYGSTAHVTHEEQRLAAKNAQLTHIIDQLLVRLEKVENRTSALEETLADGKANSMKKSGGGSKAGSNSHPRLKVSQCWRSRTFVI